MNWTREQHELFVQMAGEKCSAAQIAAAVGCTRNAIIGRARRLGVPLLFVAEKAAPKERRARPTREPRPWREPRQRRSNANRELIRALYLAGETYGVIAERCGISPGGILYHVQDLPRRRTVDTSARYDRAFKVMVVAALLTGEGGYKIHRRLGVYHASVYKWRRTPDILADATALAERIKARWAVEQEAARQAADQAAAEERARVDANNRPIFAEMTDRHRLMMAARVSGQTLESVGQAFGLTRERIRQVEAKWRQRGLIVPGAKPLSTAAARIGTYIPNGRPRGRPKAAPAAPPKDEAYWQSKVETAFAAFPVGEVRR